MGRKKNISRCSVLSQSHSVGFFYVIDHRVEIKTIAYCTKSRLAPNITKEVQLVVGDTKQDG